MRYIVFLFAIAIAVGWLMPDLTSSLRNDAPQPEPQVKIVEEVVTIDEGSAAYEELGGDDGDWDSSEIVIERSSDGHFYADAAINGYDVNFLIDTGASSIALTGDDAAALGLDWDEYDLQVVGRGASGEVYGKHVVLEEVTLGDFTARNLRAAIIPKGLDRSLLGQAFLKTIDNVNISGDQMVLK